MLAHELGHALNLPHFRDRQNLMFPASSPPGGLRGTTLQGWQTAILHANRHVVPGVRGTDRHGASAAAVDTPPSADRGRARGTITVDRCSPGPARPCPCLPGSPVDRCGCTTPPTAAVRPTAPGELATMYVCGITPYDATHLGHAATYIAFDLVQRVWLDNGHRVHYVQNITDIDDPLLERAARDGIDWRDLAAREIQLFREDMTALRVLPPQDYIGAVEAMDEVSAAVQTLLDIGRRLPGATTPSTPTSTSISRPRRSSATSPGTTWPPC